MPHAKRWLYLVHRWLGVLLCAFFAMWFLSGVVMMYVGYPKLTDAEVAGAINMRDAIAAMTAAVTALLVLAASGAAHAAGGDVGEAAGGRGGGGSRRAIRGGGGTRSRGFRRRPRPSGTSPPRRPAPSARAPSGVLRRETELGANLPYARHVSDYVVALDSRALMICFIRASICSRSSGVKARPGSKS